MKEKLKQWYIDQEFATIPDLKLMATHARIGLRWILFRSHLWLPFRSYIRDISFFVRGGGNDRCILRGYQLSCHLYADWF